MPNDMTPEDSLLVGLDQLYRELHAVIKRHTHESDGTAYGIIGALEAVKLDVMDMIQRSHKSNPAT